MTFYGIDWRGRAPQLLAGTVLSLALFLGVAALSARPEWQSLPPDTGLVRLSFTHSGARDCRDRTEEELAALPRNMRAQQVCARRRAPLRIEMDVDGDRKLTAELPPSGLAGSGPSRVYDRVVLPVGEHHIELRMNDDPAVEGFPHVGAFDITLRAAQSVAVDFDPAKGGFFLH